MMSSATSLWKIFRDQAERGSGIGLKLFGFIAESVFTIIPESCSGSSWNSVRNHPGIAFTLDRIPHQGMFVRLFNNMGSLLFAQRQVPSLERIGF